MWRLALTAGLLLSGIVAAQAPETFEPGDRAVFPSGAELRSRPTTEGSPTAVIAADSACTLIARAVNQTGTWWFVDTGVQKGWVQEHQLAMTVAASPAPLPPTPTPPPSPSPPPLPPPAAPVLPKAQAEPATLLSREAPAIRAGMDELEFDATVSRGTQDIKVFGFSAEADYKRVSAGLAYGHFFTQHHELGFAGSFSWVDFDFGSSDKFYEWSAGPRYTLNFPSEGSTIVPFLSGEYQWIWGDSDGTAYEGSLGFRALATRSISLNCRAYYQAYDVADTSDPSFKVENEGAEYGLRFGFSWLIQ